jgi:lipoprotein-anchoring transpeptidase ErfK/SrfK
MRKLGFLPIFCLAAASAASPASADPWANMRVAQAGPQVITAPRDARVVRDYERQPVGRPDFAQPQPQYRNDLGGGFIEFLFTGRNSYGGQLPRPSYVQPQYDMRPQYEARPQYEYDRRSPYYQGGPVIQARRDQPGVGSHPQTRAIDPRFLPQRVQYQTKEKAGTVVIDSSQKFLYLVEEGGMAMRYGVGVGRDGFGWSGTKNITAKKEWPDWRPPEEMLQRRPDLPRYMAGGPDNPLGARALYLGDSLYRIHGSNEPHTIGQAVSSGCFRMRNEDVIELYERVGVGTKVVVL